MVGKVNLKRVGGWDPQPGEEVKDPSLPLETGTSSNNDPRGHGATVIDPRKKPGKDRRRKHGG